MSVPMPMIVVRVPMAMPVVVVRISMILVLAVMASVVVSVLLVKLIAVPVVLPATMPAPVGMLATLWERSPVAESRIVVAIDIPSKSNRPMKPRACAQEHSA